jgi:hypothetical protein
MIILTYVKYLRTSATVGAYSTNSTAQRELRAPYIQRNLSNRNNKEIAGDGRYHHQKKKRQTGWTCVISMFQRLLVEIPCLYTLWLLWGQITYIHEFGVRPESLRGDLKRTFECLLHNTSPPTSTKILRLHLQPKMKRENAVVNLKLHMPLWVWLSLDEMWYPIKTSTIKTWPGR